MDTTTKNVRGGVLTREQFLPYEMRIVAGLRAQGISPELIIERVERENLFQYPTERMLADRTRVCLRRLDAMEPTASTCAVRGIDPATAHEAVARLVHIMASGDQRQSAQAILYSMVCRYDLVRELILVEVGERLQRFDYSLTSADLNAFITRFQTEYDGTGWTDATIKRIKGTLRQCLTQVGLISAGQGEEAETLCPLMLGPDVEYALEQLGERAVITALTGRSM